MATKAKKKKVVSRMSTMKLTDELSSVVDDAPSVVSLAVIVAPIYAAKWRENMDHQANDRLGNRELMQMSILEARELLGLCK